MREDGVRLPPGLALSWGVYPVQRRGPKPALSVERIVATGIEFGDTQGFEAISLQKIAAHLGVTTNAMYRYVRSKEELLVLVRDAAWGPPPPLPGTGWRDDSAAWVRAQLDRYGERPWLLDMPIHGAPVTPNLLRWAEVMLQALDGTGLSHHDNLGCVLLLDGFVRAHASLMRQLAASDAEPVQSEDVGRFLVPRLAEGNYPMLTKLYTTAEYSDDVDEDGVDDDLEFGLTRILDGIQVLISLRPKNRGS
ncbi:TetR family transcriptional regulator [Kribbella sp. VKM Ac-2527]|uniref:TetR family transcriptional regulator n=1 Tax=Kribbella caucasensis TaxID=2512215 RepID=A0A4R6K6C5_9ACTN|nr:TetR/AcrR family transcriptional regulator C-terminal domain-containing protein [Kribbella sp. VKM Ac-2527]TDO44895.1 TetR family transcriptional regulator [Kribbella sp. VKM Ac-2527]